MNTIYVTADKISNETGGGQVTRHEYIALSQFTQLHPKGKASSIQRFGRDEIGQQGNDPWGYDDYLADERMFPADLAHFYAGTFTKTIDRLKKSGCKITYTAAAHDVTESRKEHETLGLRFDYPHLTEKPLWDRYVRGYLDADVLVVPSSHSAGVMRRFGFTGRVEIVPHGHDVKIVPAAPTPSRFIVGYLGAVGPDKGLRYLLEAWRELNYKDAELHLAGQFSTNPFVTQMINQFGGGKVLQIGWVPSITYFYNSISLYIQPSVSEGFGIEVLEALAHGRCVLCSRGAGAHDVLPTEAVKFEPRDVKSLAQLIDHAKRNWITEETSKSAQEIAKKYTWPLIRQRYIDVWSSLFSEEQ